MRQDQVLSKALAMLEDEYRLCATTAINVTIASFCQKTLKRIEKVKRDLLPIQNKKVADLRPLENLINDLLPHHSYKFEKRGEQDLVLRADELLFDGSPTSIDSTVRSRCRDGVGIDWAKVVAGFPNGFIQSAAAKSFKRYQ